MTTPRRLSAADYSMSLRQHSTSEVRLLGQQHEHAPRLSTGRPIETQSTGDPQTSLPETTYGQAPWLRALSCNRQL
jgi:hypothetical protein